MGKERSVVGNDNSSKAVTRTIVGECPLCSGESFSRSNSAMTIGYLKLSRRDCKLAYRIWIDRESPT